MMLFFWLVNGGIGTACARLFFSKRRAFPKMGLACLSVLLACLPAILIVLIRVLRDIFFLPGISTGFYETAGYVLLTTGAYSLLVGFTLPYSLHVIRISEPAYKGAWLYILDNIGDTLGGIAFVFFLVVFLTPMQAAVSTGTVLLLISFWMLSRAPAVSLITAVLVHAAGAAVLAACLMADASTHFYGAPGELVRTRDSAHGRITVMRDGELVTLYSDGMPFLFGTDIVNVEEAVHYPLSQLPDGRNILLISGKGGIMDEIDKHHPDTVDYVELNPEIVKAGFDYGIYKRYPWLSVIHMDGRRYLQRTDKKYDAVLMNLPEPSNFQLNRFYTNGFFHLAKKGLQSGGVLCFAVSGFENYMTENQVRKISSLYHTALQSFENVLVIPGQQVYFLCSDKKLHMDIPELLRAKNIATSYIDGYFYGDISQWKIDEVNNRMDPKAALNLDLSPNLIQIIFLQWFEKYQSTPYLLGIVAAISLVFYLVRQNADTFLLFSTGYVIMGFEILVIFIVQIYFGFIYEMIGAVVTVFLGGLLPGALFALKHRSAGKPLLIGSDAALIGLLGLFLIILDTIGNSTVWYFILFGFMASFLGGFQVPVLLQKSGDTESGLARFFTADLIGAATGILVTSVVLIPKTGFRWAVVSLISLKLMSLLVIVWKKG